MPVSRNPRNLDALKPSPERPLRPSVHHPWALMIMSCTCGLSNPFSVAWLFRLKHLPDYWSTNLPDSVNGPQLAIAQAQAVSWNIVPWTRCSVKFGDVHWRRTYTSDRTVCQSCRDQEAAGQSAGRDLDELGPSRRCDPGPTCTCQRPGDDFRKALNVRWFRQSS